MTTLEELQRAATHVTVPGAPLTLRLDGLCKSPGAEPRVSWSFEDPMTEDEILIGTTLVRGDAAQVWAEAQLDAAWVFVLHVDDDWLPGAPPTRRSWTEEEAWAALLEHMGELGRIEVVGDEVRTWGKVLCLTPTTWAAYLNSVEDRDPERDQYVVPAGTGQVTGLPGWVADEIDWGCGDARVLDLTADGFRARARWSPPPRDDEAGPRRNRG